MKELDQNFVLFTDTDTDITPKVAKYYGYNLISMPYKLDGTDVYPYIDFEEFKDREFYEKLRHGAMPTTFALSPKNYEDYFEPFFKSGKDILYVHLSKAMSGTFNSMNIALKTLKEKYPERNLYTIDTKGITICSYGIVREVGDMYLEGKTLEEILEWAKTEVDKFPTYFFVNDLSFFRRSGRVKAITAFMGNLLGIRPILNMDSDGLMAPKGKARGLNGAIDKLMEIIDELQDNILDHRVIIGHSDAIGTVELLKKRLIEKFGDQINIEVVSVNPTAGSHCGPDGVGICFHGIHR